MQALRLASPSVWLIYGGVFPTYHWPEIMEEEPDIDFIVRGEGEQTVVRLIDTLKQSGDLSEVPGIMLTTRRDNRGTAPGKSGMPGW